MLIGLAAGTVGLLVACETALAQSGKYKESPALAEQVGGAAAGGRRIGCPSSRWSCRWSSRSGEYGGVWRRAFLGPADANNYVRVVYDSLFRFSPDGAKIEPKVAAGADASADFKTWTIWLRKGARWSDGAPIPPTTSCSGTATSCSTRT